ncbi:hypothetical protein M0805_005206 [Coniferiporia weirii]|nr:hypothetical protein M0805_005206 [Coniferiporia weirii]
MSKVVLSSIPTLRQLYANGSLRPATLPPRYKPAEGHLDRVSIYEGDITELEVDAIVNAANSSLLGGGGVDGAIHQAAGDGLLDECRTLGGCLTGDAKMTVGYNLPSKHVIHTVGPVYSDRSAADISDCARLLASCYRRSLALAANNALTSIAFPSVSAGVYGYPIADAARIALAETRRFLDENDVAQLTRVVFTVHSAADRSVYEKLSPEYFPRVPGDPDVSERRDPA